LAHGLADDLLTEAALAHAGPVLVAPAMNTRMWTHEATQANVATLRAREVEFVGPVEGELAEGEEGIGRMAEPEDIFDRVEELLRSQATSALRGKRVVVSAGGTMNREAAALGVPVYTTYGGRLGGVDEALIREGRLRPLTDPRALELVKRSTEGTRVRREPHVMLDLLLSALPG